MNATLSSAGSAAGPCRVDHAQRSLHRHVIGCLKARTVPVNINYHYTPREVAELLDYLQPRAVIYHRSLGAKFADMLPPVSADLLVSVDDGSTVPQLAGACRWMMHWCRGHRPGCDGVARRSADDLHRRHHRSAQGRALAAVRYLRLVDGRRGSRVRPGDSRQGARGRGTVVRRLTADARRRHVDGVLGDHGRTPVVLYDTGKKLDPRSVWQTASVRRSA